jgi:hypothetical protein
MSLRGHLCKICNALGAHFTSECPERGSIGVPRFLLKKTSALAPAAADAAPASAPAHVLSAVYAHAAVPSALRCRGCCILAREPVWLPCCDAVACFDCLGPVECPATCPVCHAALRDGDFFVVGALRDLSATLVETLAAIVEPDTTKAMAAAAAAVAVAVAPAPALKPTSAAAAGAAAAPPVLQPKHPRQRRARGHGGGGGSRAQRKTGQPSAPPT